MSATPYPVTYVTYVTCSAAKMNATPHLGNTPKGSSDDAPKSSPRVDGPGRVSRARSSASLDSVPEGAPLDGSGVAAPPPASSPAAELRKGGAQLGQLSSRALSRSLTKVRSTPVTPVTPVTMVTTVTPRRSLTKDALGDALRHSCGPETPATAASAVSAVSNGFGLEEAEVVSLAVAVEEAAVEAAIKAAPTLRDDEESEEEPPPRLSVAEGAQHARYNRYNRYNREARYTPPRLPIAESAQHATFELGSNLRKQTQVDPLYSRYTLTT